MTGEEATEVLGRIDLLVFWLWFGHAKVEGILIRGAVVKGRDRMDGCIGPGQVSTRVSWLPEMVREDAAQTQGDG